MAKADRMNAKVFNGATGDWRIHLHPVATLVPILVRVLPITPESSDSSSSEDEHGGQDMRSLSTEDNAAIKFLLGAFIWLDILSCVSTGSKPFLSLEHGFVLESGGIRLEELVGCENWAAILVFDISVLDNWKRELERSHKLSIAELAKRGALIEERLKEKLAETSIQEPIPMGDFSRKAMRFLRSSTTDITKIFALSALTYLHVVISGSHPELPEIAESVSNTIAAFRALTDPKLLRNLVWPFCITGCLASEGQQSIFHDLVLAAEVDEQTVGTCLEAMKIVEECWRIRKTGSRNCDWVFVMNSLGHHVLLA
jgi:hypothetical protein